MVGASWKAPWSQRLRSAVAASVRSAPRGGTDVLTASSPDCSKRESRWLRRAGRRSLTLVAVHPIAVGVLARYPERPTWL
jgi:hypothetical protein